VRREGIDAVLVSRWRWDGRRRVREERAGAAELEAAAVSAHASGGLF